jgi:hypothetical protein
MAWLAVLLVDVDTLAVVACLALTAATLIFIFLIVPDAADSAPHRSRLDQLLEQRDTVYDNLRDVKFEYRAGKFTEQDYQQMKELLEGEAALVLAEIETFTGSPARLPRRNPGTSPAGVPAKPRG